MGQAPSVLHYEEFCYGPERHASHAPRKKTLFDHLGTPSGIFGTNEDTRHEANKTDGKLKQQALPIDVMPLLNFPFLKCIINDNVCFMGNEELLLYTKSPANGHGMCPIKSGIHRNSNYPRL